MFFFFDEVLKNVVIRVFRFYNIGKLIKTDLVINDQLNYLFSMKSL